jgi:hypothetical protein
MTRAGMVIGAAIICSATTAPIATGQRNAANSGPIRACSLLPAAEVKKLSALPDPLNLFEKMKPEEESIGRGSSCNYPSVHVQIDPFDWTTIDAQRGKNPAQFEAVAGVGDAAFLRANKGRSVEFAELYAKVGPHVLTIQMDVPDGASTASVKPGVVALARAYAAKLR